MQALDFGLSPTVNRELARYSAFPDKSDQARDFIRTLEIGYWLLGVVIGLAVYAAAPFLSIHWLQRSAMPADVIRRAIEIMAVAIAVQWPLTFYQGGLMGLERHAALNVVKVSMAVLAAAGGYVVVTRVSPTIIALLWWQCAVGLVHVGLATAALWQFLPPSNRPARVRSDAVRNIGKFAGGMTMITATTLVLTQLDRIVLSRMLSLEQFGYYVLAGTVSSGLSFLVLPLFTSVFPRFSALVAAGDRASLEHLYRRAWGLAMALVVPCALVIALFPVEILTLVDWRLPGGAVGRSPGGAPGRGQRAELSHGSALRNASRRRLDELERQGQPHPDRRGRTGNSPRSQPLRCNWRSCSLAAAHGIVCRCRVAPDSSQAAPRLWHALAAWTDGPADRPHDFDNCVVSCSIADATRFGWPRG